MPKTKYGKYFSTEVVKEVDKRPGAFVTSTRHLEKFGGGHLSVDAIYINHPHLMISQPHKHEFPQYLNFYSANPRNPKDFDAEIEMTLGEEAEKHIIKSPTALYIPAGLMHGPLNFAKINKPVLFIDIAVTGKYTRVGNTPD
ncbi:MAG: hypothetical protein A2Z15_05945 [Chloroflexi bacterium RBG_16_50_11]|nr:MAG: hypothetical protein A2Z15_05945 [Chloroflexi bacterium RBG_16_50_11]